MDPQLNKYERHILLDEIGPLGHQKIRNASVLIVGCGALGSTQAQLLARAGVGRIRLADPDRAEFVNLHRQLLFDEEDAKHGRKKALVAREKLLQANSDISIESFEEKVCAQNIERLAADVDLILDATDNFSIRYVINDYCVKHEKPWIYGGIITTTGMTLSIYPQKGPCLRCVFPTPPLIEEEQQRRRLGILNTCPALVATLQVTEALKCLVGEKVEKHDLLVLDIWLRDFRSVQVQRDPNCPCCGKQQFPFLEVEGSEYLE